MSLATNNKSVESKIDADSMYEWNYNISESCYCPNQQVQMTQSHSLCVCVCDKSLHVRLIAYIDLVECSI